MSSFGNDHRSTDHFALYNQGSNVVYVEVEQSFRTLFHPFKLVPLRCMSHCVNASLMFARSPTMDVDLTDRTD